MISIRSIYVRQLRITQKKENTMKKLLLTTMIAVGSIGAQAEVNYLNSHTFGNTTSTYGQVGGNSVNLTTSRFGNNVSTYGSVGRGSVNINSNTFGNTTSTYGNIGSSRINGQTSTFGNSTNSFWTID